MDIMKRKPLNRYSLKKIAELNAEVPIRIELCKRAGGTPIKTKQTAYHNSKPYPITRILCWGGKCECCGERADTLEPHEQMFRSHGGKLSMENSLMVKRGHHPKLQNNELHFTKTERCIGSIL